MPITLSIIGRRGSGKSQALEILIASLKAKGLRIGVIKHLAQEDMEIDEPQKDTYRYRQHGAETVILAGKKRMAVFSNLTEEISLEKLLGSFAGYDLVFLDGWFVDSIPMIEVWRRDLGAPLGCRMKNIFAVCSDEKSATEAPHIPPSQIHLLASLIEEKFFGEVHV